MGKKTLTLPAVVAAASGFAGAQISNIGPFTGDHTETWETLAPPGNFQGPLDIFGGFGTSFDSLANNTIIAINLFSFGTNEEIFAHNGNFMAGSVTSWYTFEFDSPVRDFGSFIGTVDNIDGGSVSFFDSSDALIASVPLSIPLNDWQWFGWHSDIPFTRVEVKGNTNPGLPIVFDDTQVRVPAPGSVALLAMSGLAVTRRRR